MIYGIIKRQRWGYSQGMGQLSSTLAEKLKKEGYWPLHAFQAEVFEKFLAGKNVFINSCTGSGKTLAYLTPVLHSLPEKTLILTLNKELCTQIYRLTRVLAPTAKVRRLGSIAHLSPVIDLLAKGDDEDTIESVIDSSLAAAVNWKQLDILISTPAQYRNLMFTKSHEKINNGQNPNIIVVDEADLLLELDKNISKATHNILEDHKGSLLFSASSFPAKYDGCPSRAKLTSKFRPLTFVDGPNRHCLPDSIELNYIPLKSHPTQSKQSLLTWVLREGSPVSKSTIVFCNSADAVKAVGEYLRGQGFNPIEYHAQLPSEQRAEKLIEFEKSGGILVSTDLGSRGLDMMVDLVIEYELAKNVVDFLNRAGRTGRSFRPGKLVSFVEAHEEDFFDHIKSLHSNAEGFDEIFSRRRSYSKRVKVNSDVPSSS